MMMQQLTTQDDTRPCLVCSKEGARHAVEVLPDGGILFMVAHDNGQICKWSEYAGISNVIKPKKKRDMPTYIQCPKCGEQGKLNWAYDINAAKEERPFTVKYLVVHERIPGSWGKVKVKRHRRCQSFTPEQRIAILKQVGRYIADPPKPGQDRKKVLGIYTDEQQLQVEDTFRAQTKPQSIATEIAHRKHRLPKIICPLCGKEGSAGYLRSANRFYVRHQKDHRCFMKNEEQKQVVSKALRMPETSAQQTLDAEIKTTKYDTASTKQISFISKPRYIGDAGRIEQRSRRRPHAKGWHRRQSQHVICANCQKPGRSAGPTKSLKGYVSVYHKPEQPGGKSYYHLMKIDEWQKQARVDPTTPVPRLASSLALDTLNWHVPLIDCPRCGKADGRAQKPRKQGDMYINHGSGSYSTSCHLDPLQTVSLLSYIIVSQSQKLEERDKSIAELGKKLQA